MTPNGNPPQNGGQAPKPKSGAAPAQANPQGQQGRVTLSKGTKKVGISMKALKQAHGAAPVEEKESDTPVEERVFAIAGLKDISEPAIFTQFQEKMVPSLKLADTSWSILEAFSNIDVTAEKVAAVLKTNPYYEYHFMKVLENLSKREEMPSLEGAIVLMGMQNFRNLVIALQMNRCAMNAHAEWDKDGKLKLVPADLLKNALKTEELLISKKSEYSDTAYTAGLVFDLLMLISDKVSADKKKVGAYIETLYAHGLRTAQIGAELAEHLPEIGFKKYIFAACLIHDIGKAVLAILNPDYITFLEDVRKKELSRHVRQYAEKRKFEVDHAFLGAIICQNFRIFRPIEKAILFHHEPYLLKQVNPGLYQLAALVALSTNIANSFKKIDKADDPIIPIWKGYDLKDFQIPFKALAETVSKIQI